MAPIQTQNQTVPRFSIHDMPTIDPAKHSKQKNHMIQSYAANTHSGLVRNYNEDRVSIILNIVRPENKKHIQDWPDCSYFAIYDGHGGDKCAEYLRDNLHQLVNYLKIF